MKYLLDSQEVLRQLYSSDEYKGVFSIVYVSRTSHTEWANELLGLMELQNKEDEKRLYMKDICVCEWNQIFPADKQKHFFNLRGLSKVDYRDCIFFDNQMNNIKSVSQLGVTCVYTPDGMHWGAWKEGLERWRQSNCSDQRSSALEEPETILEEPKTEK